MPFSDIQAIDVHAHHGTYIKDGGGIRAQWGSGGVDVLLARAAKANTRITIVSSLEALMPRGRGNPLAGNERLAPIVAETDGLMMWVVVDPLKPDTYAQAAELLNMPKVAGLKIHPEEHLYSIREHGRAIFEFAEQHNAIVSTHSGEQRSLPEDFVRFANDFPGVTIIVCHLGCGFDDDPTHQVRAIQASKHGNLYTDCSSAQNITPCLLEYAVAEIGADRIMYGTDSPLYFAPMQRARVEYADISEEQKRMILCENASRLFKLEL